MRVLFDAHWWIDGPPSNKEVMKRVVLTWSELFPQDELILAVPQAAVAAALHEFPEGARVYPTRLPIQGISAIFELPLIARKAHAEVTISHNFTPLFGRSAVFIQDFLFLSNPEWFTLKERLYFSLMRETMTRASYVFSSSETEGRRIASFSRKPLKQVSVGLAANAELVQARPQRPESLGDLDGFLLSVGRLNVRKNLATILIAAAESGRISPNFPLIVVGERSGRTAPLPPSVKKEIDSGAIRFLGFTPDSELAWLYANASLFVFLSLDEGFGMPPLEASAFKTPMLVSDIPVFREILRDAASYVDPVDVEAVKAAIQKLAGSDTFATDHSESPAERYTWAASVTKMRDAIVK